MNYLRYDGVVNGMKFLWYFDGRRDRKKKDRSLVQGNFDGKNGDVPLDDRSYCLHREDVDGRAGVDEEAY